MTRRVRRPAQYKDLMVKLVLDKENTNAPFGTYKDVMMFAATYGFANGDRIPFTETLEPIAWETFSSDPMDKIIIQMLVLANGDFDLLAPDRFDDCLTVFEEYANCGLTKIEEKTRNQKIDIDRHIEDLIYDYKTKKDSTETDVTSLANDFF